MDTQACIITVTLRTYSSALLRTPAELCAHRPSCASFVPNALPLLSMAPALRTNRPLCPTPSHCPLCPLPSVPNALCTLRPPCAYVGKEGPKTKEPSKYIRYIYNRIILENATVRAAAVSSLASFGAQVRACAYMRVHVCHAWTSFGATRCVLLRGGWRGSGGGGPTGATHAGWAAITLGQLACVGRTGALALSTAMHAHPCDGSAASTACSTHAWRALRCMQTCAHALTPTLPCVCVHARV